MKIGLTGSIACGKSTVSAYLRELGCFVSDADAISHVLTRPGGAALPAIRRAFGDGVFDGDILNRRALGSLVFGSYALRERLNAILHPMIAAQMDSELAREERADMPVFADIPLLYECGMESRFDRIWVIAAPKNVQLERLMMRDSLSREEALQRIAAQMPLEEKIARADAVIWTDRPIHDTQRQVLDLLSAAGRSHP